MNFQMKIKYILPFSLLICVSMVGCDEDEEVEIGNWVELGDCDCSRRGSAVSFVIGDRAYVGTGYDGEDYLKDFYAYEAATNSWFAVPSLPDTAAARSSAVAFSIGDKGYVGTGVDSDRNELKDFWSYDVTKGTWERVADFGGTARHGAIAFALDGKGYVGTGDDGDEDRKDMWQYDPTIDEWKQVASFGGVKKTDAAVFVIGDLAYVATGAKNGVLDEEFFAYDPVNDRWESRLPVDEEDDYNIMRSGAVAFALDGKGYIAMGSTGGSRRDVWEYDPLMDEWEEKTELDADDGSSRVDAVAFVVSNRAFITTGRNGSIRLDDIWEFEPDEEDDEDD